MASFLKRKKLSKKELEELAQMIEEYTVPIYPKWKFSLIPNQVVELSVGFKEKQESPIKEEDFPELGTIQYNSVQLEKNKWGNMQWKGQVNQKQQIQKIIENMVCMGARCRCNIMPKYMPYGKDVSATCKKTLGKLG